MNLENLNVVELSSEEMVETTGGSDYWWDHPGILDVIFEVRNPRFL